MPSFPAWKSCAGGGSLAAPGVRAAVPFDGWFLWLSAAVAILLIFNV